MNINDKLPFTDLLKKIDVLTNIDQQVVLLKQMGFVISLEDEVELRHIIINYGFNCLFIAYIKPFMEGDNFIKNLEINNIISLYYFDRNFATIIFKFLGFFEHKLTSNIINQTNIEEPDFTKQLAYLYANPKSRNQLLKNIKFDLDNGSLFLKPFINNKIYPAWIVANTGTLSDKYGLLNRLKDFDNINKNFYINNINDLKNIINNFLRIIRNGTAHYERMIKFYVVLNTSKFTNLMIHFLETYLPKDVFKMLNEQYSFSVNNNYNTFIVIVVLCHLLSKAQAQNLILELNQLFATGIITTNLKNFDFNKEILSAANVLNWPLNWKVMLNKIVDNKVVIT